METNKAKKTQIIIIIILSLVVIYLVVDKFIQKGKTEEIIAQLEYANIEKQNISDELKDLYTQYDGLKTENDTINARLETEKQKIADLMEEVKRVKSSNARKIREYKKELKTLRAIMRSYIVQIDSLNTSNQKLRAEVGKVNKKYQSVLNEKKGLSKEIDSLSSTVEKAATLKALNLVASGMNVRGKDTKKIKKIDKFRVCFTIAENVIADQGERWVYIRIAKPNGNILKDTEYNLFEFEGKEIVYTAKRKINYDGKQNNVCVYWKKNEPLEEGVYIADVFTDNKQIGTTHFTLK